MFIERTTSLGARHVRSLSTGLYIFRPSVGPRLLSDTMHVLNNVRNLHFPEGHGSMIQHIFVVVHRLMQKS